MDAVDVRGMLGLLLADGSLTPYRTPGGGFVQLTLTAGASESAFLEDKVAECRHFIATKAQIVPYMSTPRSNGRSTMILRFRVSSSKLQPVYNLLYPRGVRRITPVVLEMLGAQAAAWLWAEGARPVPDGGADLARVGASDNEAASVGQWLQVLTGAEADIVHDRIKPRLHYPKDQARKIREALASYAPASRSHLFEHGLWDVSTIRSARTELLFWQRSDLPARAPESSLA